MGAWLPALKGLHPRASRKAGRLRLMFLPILDFEDGYGFSYGVQVARPEPVGTRSRLSFPLTWGGDKRAGVRFDKELEKGPLTRVQAGADIERRTNPFFEEDDDRDRVLVRAERDVGRSLRLGATAAWEHVSFLDAHDRFVRTGADVVLDTRIDPMLARNAVYARAAWDHLAFRTGRRQSHRARGARLSRAARAERARAAGAAAGLGPAAPAVSQPDAGRRRQPARIQGGIGHR